ncbi:MAG: rhomboid family intramembrane serine protease [Burkholderiales bacterium]|jgi:membrane associated rhomboid family serine protease|nr:rhomboid family intramembrane serine protease [Burkholderiales bacterium]
MKSMTQLLLLVTTAASMLAFAAGGAPFAWFALWPLAGGFAPWQLLTYALLHGGLLHLAFNMYGLWMFGSELERLWGPRRLLQYYVVSVLVAGLVQLVVASDAPVPYPTVGASGGLFGLLLGYAMLFPHRRLMLLFPPIPMPAWLFAVVFGLLELTLGFSATQSGIAHFAHVGGMLGGWLMLRYWRGQPPFGRRR